MTRSYELVGELPFWWLNIGLSLNGRKWFVVRKAEGLMG